MFIAMGASSEPESLSSQAERFIPVTLDTAPLHHFLQAISRQVDAFRHDNTVLRNELADLRSAQRLETLELAVQSLADMQQPVSSGFGAGGGGGGGAQLATPASSSGEPPASESHKLTWVLGEMTSMKNRMALMERKSEALWHEQGAEEQLRGEVERVKTDLEEIKNLLTEVASVSDQAHARVDGTEDRGSTMDAQLSELQDKIRELACVSDTAREEHSKMKSVTEGKVHDMYEHIMALDRNLNERMAAAEAGQASTREGMDATQATSASVTGRTDDLRKQCGMIEGKIEALNASFNVALAPLHSGLSSVNARVEELDATKLDTHVAMMRDDVERAAAQAIDHSDRRADNIFKALGGIESRLEQLSDDKSNKWDVVMSSDLETLLTAHACEMDLHFENLKVDIQEHLQEKADKNDMVNMNAILGARVSTLEAALMKGLRAISERVSSALVEKLDVIRFNDFKSQVRAVLADVEDRLRDWSPAARGIKSGTGQLGTSTCLSCDGQVRTVKDLLSMGFPNTSKPFVPERLPTADGALPSIARSADVGAFTNARLAHRKREVASHMGSRSSVGNGQELFDASDIYPTHGFTPSATAPVSPNIHNGIYTPAMTPAITNALTIQALTGTDPKATTSSSQGSKPPSRASTNNSERSKDGKKDISPDKRASLSSVAEYSATGKSPSQPPPRQKRPSEMGFAPWTNKSDPASRPVSGSLSLLPSPRPASRDKSSTPSSGDPATSPTASQRGSMTNLPPPVVEGGDGATDSISSKQGS